MIRVTRGKVLVKPKPAEKKSEGLIHVLKEDAPAISRGVVLHVGAPHVTANGVEVPHDVHEADVVLYPTRNQGTVTPEGLVLDTRELVGVETR